MPRDSVVFYRSCFEAAQCLSKTERLRFYDALFNYALNDVEPVLDSRFAGVFIMAKPLVDKNNQRFENGKKGGRPRKTKAEPNNNQNKTKAEPYEDEDVYEDVNEDEEGEGAPAPCTLEDVRAYARQVRSRSDPVRFYNYYAARGWTIEGRQIADWRALFDTWSARGDRATFVDFPQRTESFDMTELSRRNGNLL